MDLSSLPTDNLYKFLAIGGLIMCIASKTYEHHYEKDFWREQYEGVEAINKVKANRASLQEYWKALEGVGECVPREDYIKWLDRMTANDAERESMCSPTALRLRDLKIDQFLRTTDQLQYVTLFGFAVAAFGFHRWYLLQQRTDRVRKPKK